MISAFTAEDAKLSQREKVLKATMDLAQSFYDAEMISSAECAQILQSKEHHLSSNKVGIFITQRMHALLNSICASVDSRVLCQTVDVLATFFDLASKDSSTGEDSKADAGREIDLLLEC